MGKSVDLVWLPEAGPGGGGRWVLGLSAPGRALVPTRDWPLGTCCGGHPHVPGREGGCPHVHTGTCRSHSCIRGTHIGTDTLVASPRACSISTQARRPHTHTHTYIEPCQGVPEPQMHAVNTRCRRPVGETRAAGLFTPQPLGTPSAARGSGASLAGLGPWRRRWRGHDHPLSEVAPGGFLIPGAAEVTPHWAAAVRVREAAIKCVHVQADRGRARLAVRWPGCPIRLILTGQP